MKHLTLSQTEIATIIGVFAKLEGMPYDELNKMLGSMTIYEMGIVLSKLRNWYNKEVLNKEFEPGYGWVDKTTDY